MPEFEIAVIGGGPAGMITALACARASRSVVLIAPELKRQDYRTTALMDQSVEFLKRLGVWDAIAPDAAPLRTMRIIDGTGRLVRAPTANFRSAEIDLDAFGYNIPNSVLIEKLQQAVGNEPNIRHLQSAATNIETSDEKVLITTEDDAIVEAKLVVGADGRNSLVRNAAEIGVKKWSYPQTAMVLNFSHTLPHNDVSTEFHTRTGPFTQVPLPGGKRSSLVWVLDQGTASNLSAKSVGELSVAVEQRMQSLLGAVTVEEPVQTWPLSSFVAHRFGKGRMALVGEAAHGFPPIGAQGLNLSLRDIMRLARMLEGISGKAISARSGDKYDVMRKSDVWTRTLSVDLLNRSLLADFLPAQLGRAAGLHLLSSLPPLRQFAMREGVQPLKGIKALLPH